MTQAGLKVDFRGRVEQRDFRVVLSCCAFRISAFPNRGQHLPRGSGSIVFSHARVSSMDVTLRSDAFD